MKLSGVKNPTSLAKNTPARPEVDAPMANASSLTRVVLTPVACAAISSSRMAAQARPVRDCSSARNSTTTTMMMISSRYQYCSWFSPNSKRTNPRLMTGCGTCGDGPRVELVTPSALIATMRTISPKPSVTIAR